MRVWTPDGGPEPAGEPVTWPDGEVRGLRQVVDDSVEFVRSTWISRDGDAYVRSYDPFRRAWCWSAAPRAVAETPGGELLVSVGTGRRRKRIRLARAVALAWVSAPRTHVPLQALVLAEPHDLAHRIVWTRVGVREVRRLEDEPPPPSPPERWKPVKVVWRDAGGEPVLKTTLDYRVSTHGRVRRAGAVTDGVRTPGQRAHVALLVEGEPAAAWIDELVLRAFVGDGHTAVHRNGDLADNRLENLEWTTVANDRHEPTIRALEAGMALDEWCVRSQISPSTAWAHVHAAASEGTKAQLKRLRHILPSGVLAAVRTAFEDGRLDAAVTAKDVLRSCDVPGRTWPLLSANQKYQMLQLAVVFALRERWCHSCEA